MALNNVKVSPLSGLAFCQFCGREAKHIVTGEGEFSGISITQHVCDKHVPGGDFGDWQRAQAMRRHLAHLETGRYVN